MKFNLSIPKFVFLGVLVAVFLLGGIVSPTMAKSDQVLAKIGNQTITDADLEALASAVPERLRYLYLTPEGRQQTLDYIINIYVMAAEAQKQGIDKDPKFQKVLAFTQKDLTARKYLEKTSKGIVEPTEKEARDYFDKNAALYGTPESVHLRHILVKTEKDAKDVLKQLKKGAKFPDLASKVSTCPSKTVGGDLDERADAVRRAVAGKRPRVVVGVHGPAVEAERRAIAVLRRDLDARDLGAVFAFE